MVALKLSNFGGMIPAMDPLLLPDNQAALSQNAWMYTGTLEGFRQPVQVRTLTNPLAKKVYRIPIQYYDKEHIPDSYWLEFGTSDVDVLQSPVIDDQYDRFYWAGQGVSPTYNTKARIAAGSAGYTLGIPAPSVAPKITRADGKFYMDALGSTFLVRGGSASIFNSKGYAQDRNSFGTGGVDDVAYELWGATRPVSSLKGNVDKSGTPTDASSPRNGFKISGSRAELRYTTVNAGIRVTISDTGSISIGVPSQPTPATSTDPYQGKGVLETRAYVYTWVSAYGEEGPPSPATVYTGWSEDPWKVTVTAPGAPETTDRNLSKVRIYRTVTAAGGATTYFFVTEMDLAQTAYTDALTDDVVASNAILESTFWEAPPTDLLGMIAMPNGMIAGFRGNEVWFCEPYRPHAWPSPYTLAVDFPIVGLGVIGQTLIVCTTGSPYAISGMNPATMAVSKIATIEPCLSRGSIVSTPTGVAYASPNGIALAVPGRVDIVTRNLITKDHWLDSTDYLNVPALRATTLNGAYYCWGSVTAGCFEATAFDQTKFQNDDFTGSYQGAFIDISNPRISYTKLYNADPTYNCFGDPWTGEVMIIRGGKLFWLDLSKSRPHESYVWRSKQFEMPNKRNLEAMRVWFSLFNDAPELNPVRNTAQPQTLAPDQYGLVRVYADDRLVVTREVRENGEFMRIPSGFKAQIWQVEFEGRVKLSEIEMATAAKELMNV